ncbi:MAG: DNA-binding protein [Calditrichia bacterium]
MEYKKIDNLFLLQLKRGESVLDSLRSFAQEQHLNSGMIQAIGALEKVTLGYFDRNSRTYLKQDFDDVYELVSLNGNLSRVGEEPFWHIHVVLADRNFQTTGGHLFAATVAVTFEAFLTALPWKLVRIHDKSVNLNLWDLS